VCAYRDDASGRQLGSKSSWKLLFACSRIPICLHQAFKDKSSTKQHCSSCLTWQCNRQEKRREKKRKQRKEKKRKDKKRKEKKRKEKKRKEKKRKEKKTKEKTEPCSVNIMRSQVSHQAAQANAVDYLSNVLMINGS